MEMIKPLEYSNVPIQMMSSIAEDIQQQNILDQKKYQEEFNQGLRIAQMISPEVLNKNFDSEVVNSGLGALRARMTEYIKKNPNATSGQIQSVLQQELGPISTWSNSVKAIKGKLEETFKQIPQDKKVNKDRWMNAALTKALYKNNPDGTRSLRRPEELDVNYDYATDVWEKDGEAFIDLQGVTKEIDDKIKNSAKNKENVTVTVGATRNKPGFTRVDNIEMPVWAEWDATNNRVTVKKKDGVIDPDVYTSFIGGPNTEYDKFATIKVKSALANGELIGGIKAEDVINKDGSIKDPSKFEDAKKAWVTQYLEKFAPVTQTDKEVTQPARIDVVVNNNPKGGDDQVIIDAVKNIKSYMQENPRKEGMNWYPVTAFDDISQDVIIGKARRVTGINSIGLADVQVQDFDGTPYVVSSKDITDPNDPTKVLYKAGQPLSPIGKQANMSANKPLGTKAVKTAAAGGNKRTGAAGL